MMSDIIDVKEVIQMLAFPLSLVIITIYDGNYLFTKKITYDTYIWEEAPCKRCCYNDRRCEVCGYTRMMRTMKQVSQTYIVDDTKIKPLICTMLATFVLAFISQTKTYDYGAWHLIMMATMSAIAIVRGCAITTCALICAYLLSIVWCDMQKSM